MDKLDHLGWVVENWYEIGGVSVGVRTTSGSFGALLDDALSAYKVDPLDGTPYFGLVLADGAEGSAGEKKFDILYRGTQAVLRTLDRRSFVRALFAELEALTFENRDDAIFLNAGVVWSNGSAALMPARVVSSLGELGRRVDRAGIGLPAESYVAVDVSTGKITPIMPTLQIREGAFEALSTGASRNGGVARRAVDEPLGVDLVCSFGLSDFALVPASRAKVLSTHLASVVNLTRLGVRAVEGLARLVGEARCYEMVPAEPRATLDTVVSAFGSDRQASEIGG